MKYMEARDERGELKRAALDRVAPWARSVIVCAINYNTAEPYSSSDFRSDSTSASDSTPDLTSQSLANSTSDSASGAASHPNRAGNPTFPGQAGDPARGWISRYAWGGEDYHDAVLRRLRALEDQLRNLVGAKAEEKAPLGSASVLGVAAKASAANASASQSGAALQGEHPTNPPVQFRSYVDTGPLVERVYAKYAGVGWIGKNTCIINQKLGSWLFLGVILTSLELETDIPAPDRCGSCTRCIDACPTQAIIAPGQLDARLCISYLTIEKRGAVPEELRTGIGRHVFGCDICQDVCPWNRKAPITAAPEFQARGGLVNPALDWLAVMGPEEFRRTFRESPVRRTKLSGLRRNAVIAMGNSGDTKFLPTLRALAKDSDPIVAEHARWAAGKLGLRPEVRMQK